MRRMIVAYVEVESDQARMLRTLGVGTVLIRMDHDPRDHYWCAADKPEEGDSFKLAPVYRTHKVPVDAECEDCGIGIRELQADLTSALTRKRP